MKTNILRKTVIAAVAVLLSASAFGQRITFCNPLDVVVDNERSQRGGEPVVIVFQDDYYLFVSHRKGYWYSDDFQNWTYVDAPNYPGGVVSVVERNGVLYGCSMNNKRVYKCNDAKKGDWVLLDTQFDSDRYGDANMWCDEDGRLYLYYGWSQLMPFKVVELDPLTFKEISEPKVLFFSDYKKHGFETRRHDDVIYSIFNGRRDYYAEEYPWIEGPWMIKHNGKYYLQYAAIGLEFLSYSHGVYVSDSPMGPFTYAGRLMEPVIGWTTHHSIVEYKGKWYLFYHDCEFSNGVNHRRCVKFTEIEYNADGTIKTIHPYDHKEK